MRGHIRKRGDSWQLLVTAGKDPLSGKRRQISRTVKGGRRDAEKALAQLITEVERGVHATTREATVDVLLDEWLRLSSPRWGELTRLHTSQRVDNHIRPVLGHLRLEKLRPQTLERFYASLPDSVAEKCHSHLHAALDLAVRWEWLIRNPADVVRKPSAKATERKPPTPDDVQRVMKVAPPPFDLIIRLAFVTGARKEELCGLRWCDLDGDELTIERAVVDARGLKVVPTKTHQSRRLRLDPETVALIAKHRERMEERAEGLRLDAYVFSLHVESLKPLRPDFVSKQFRIIRESVGVDSRFHDLRHAAATYLLDAGVPIESVSKRLGHLRKSTTQDRYAHAIASRDEEAANVLGSLLNADLHSEPRN